MACVSLEEQNHINQSARELKAGYVCVYFKGKKNTGFKAPSALSSLCAVSSILTSVLRDPQAVTDWPLPGDHRGECRVVKAVCRKVSHRDGRSLWRRTQKLMEVDSLLHENAAPFCLLLPLSITSWARNEPESKENVSCERENMFYTLLGPYHRKMSRF